MAKLSGKAIQDVARQIVAQNPGGIRYTTLVNKIVEQHPETNQKSIRGSVFDLQRTFPKEIAKPSRGLFMPAGSGDETVVLDSAEQVAGPGAKIKEVDFYEPFAEFLKDDLDEVTEAVSLGGAGLKNKWSTPDVVGTYKPSAGDLLKFSIEIVSAEVKIEPQPVVVAFGQAVAYRLFSTKTYIAMPTNLTPADRDRLETLCMHFGVGLILFDLNKNTPNFAIRVRAQRFSPDMFYVNEFAERLKQHNTRLFEKLFG